MTVLSRLPLFFAFLHYGLVQPMRKHRQREMKVSMEMRIDGVPCAVNGETEVEMSQLISAVLQHERAAAEATLGRPLVDAVGFALDVMKGGLGHALNVQQDRVDECSQLITKQQGVKHV